MKTLYHHPICPLSRQVRVILQELGAPFNMVKEDYWRKRPEFLAINKASTLPVLQETTNLTICGIYPVLEYFNENYPDQNLMGTTESKPEVRRLLTWFNDKFYRETVKIILDEKVIKLLSHGGSPRTEFLRAAKVNQQYHLGYLSSLLEERSFLGGDYLTFADIAAASQISILDYLAEINWDHWQYIRDWYSILKSRPSFRPLLHDNIPGFPPSHTYSDLDF